MAAVALNAAGFLAGRLYSPSMIGNLPGPANHLARRELASAGAFLVPVFAFIGGAAVPALVINAGRRRGLTGIYAFSILAEAVLLAVLALPRCAGPGCTAA